MSSSFSSSPLLALSLSILCYFSVYIPIIIFSILFTITFAFCFNFSICSTKAKMSQQKHKLHNAQSNCLLRSWQSRANDRFTPSDFVLPLFIINNDNASEPIDSFPGVRRFGLLSAVDYLKPLVDDGLQAVLIFASLSKDKTLEDAFDAEKNPILRLPPIFKKAFPKLTLIVDVCLCTYNQTG